MKTSHEITMIKDKDLKFEAIESCHTLGGTRGVTRGEERGEGVDGTESVVRRSSS